MIFCNFVDEHSIEESLIISLLQITYFAEERSWKSGERVKSNAVNNPPRPIHKVEDAGSVEQNPCKRFWFLVSKILELLQELLLVREVFS